MKDIAQAKNLRNGANEGLCSKPLCCCCFAKVSRSRKQGTGAAYTADYTLEHGLRWHHSAKDIDERKHAALPGEVTPPTARDIHNAISTLAIQSMKVLSSRDSHSRPDLPQTAHGRREP